MNFSQLHERLRLEIWRRIDRGMLTSGLLARQTGLRASHISNFLHKKRRLSLDALDRVLSAQLLATEDLLVNPRMRMHSRNPDFSSQELVPLVSAATAMSAPAISGNSILELIPLPAGFFDHLRVKRAASRRHWQRLIAVRLSTAQAQPMDPVLKPGAIAVLDRHYNSLTPYRPPDLNVYALRLGNGLVFRYVTFEANRLILRPHSLDHPIEAIEIGPHEAPHDPIIGRVCGCITEL